jgi:hypothetical protein
VTETGGIQDWEKRLAKDLMFFLLFFPPFFCWKNHKQDRLTWKTSSYLEQGLSNADTDMQVLFIASDVTPLIGQHPRSCTTDHIWLFIFFTPGGPFGLD